MIADSFNLPFLVVAGFFNLPFSVEVDSFDLFFLMGGRLLLLVGSANFCRKHVSFVRMKPVDIEELPQNRGEACRNLAVCNVGICPWSDWELDSNVVVVEALNCQYHNSCTSLSWTFSMGWTLIGRGQFWSVEWVLLYCVVAYVVSLYFFLLFRWVVKSARLLICAVENGKAWGGK